MSLMTKIHNTLALIFPFVLLVAIVSCVEKKPSSKEPLDTEKLTSNQPEVHGELVTAEEVKLSDTLNQQYVQEGQVIYQVKCQACHKLTTEKLVGPGWKGITIKRKPEWIMNMITNVDIMLESDPEAQRLLQECIVRMPNQHLTKEEARKILEFQRSNDQQK
jgi:mono/diheme cytochrome c family protein